MQRRTSKIAPPSPASNGGPLPAKALGFIVAVQGPGGLCSLVRVPDEGPVRCDCAAFHATKQPCPHIAAAARLLEGAP